MALGLLATIGLWWTYFDRFAGTAEARLREHDDPVLAAADGYSYLHLVIVAGIIVFAVGVKETIHDARRAAHRRRRAWRSAAASRCTCSATWPSGCGWSARWATRSSPGVAGLLAVYAFGGGLSAVWVTALATLVLAMLCVLETLEGSSLPIDLRSGEAHALSWRPSSGLESRLVGVDAVDATIGVPEDKRSDSSTAASAGRGWIEMRRGRGSSPASTLAASGVLRGRESAPTDFRPCAISMGRAGIEPATLGLKVPCSTN